MNKLIESESKFQIYSSFSLSADDISSLSLLYAPLIESDAFCLYMGFYSLLERNSQKSETLTHQSFFDIYSLKAAAFYKSRIKLEAIGLLNTYQNEEGNYIYILNPPLSPKSFIKDAQLGIYLYSKMSRETFDYIHDHFKIEKPNKADYEEITKSFTDVFETSVYNDLTYKKFDYILGKNPTPSLKIENNSFSFDKFKERIELEFLEIGITENFKNQIINMAFTYNFNESEMASLYRDSINKRGLYDYRLMKKNANNLFIVKYNTKAPSLVVKDENRTISSNGDLVDYLENVTPEVLLASLVKVVEPKMMDRINDVYTNISLPRGVLNAMILKVVKSLGGDVPTLKYFEKVSESWIKDNIYTTEDAIKYITTTDFTNKQEEKEENGGFEEL